MGQWYQHTQDVVPRMKNLEQPFSFLNGTSLNKKEANGVCSHGEYISGTGYKNAGMGASTIFSLGTCSKQEGGNNISASVHAIGMCIIVSLYHIPKPSSIFLSSSHCRIQFQFL